VRSVFLASAALLCLVSFSAQADDKLLPGAAPVISWTGFYAGAQAGYAKTQLFEDTSGGRNQGCGPFCSLNGGGEPATSAKGAIGGVHIGYNQQFGSAFVAGVEVDAETASGKGLYGAPAGGMFSRPQVRGQSSWQGSLRGRLGFVFDRVLVFATGGVTLLAAKYETVPNTAFPVSDRLTRRLPGFTLGAGFEYALGGNWFARGEYRYVDFGLFGRPTLVGASILPATNRTTQNVVRLGLSYNFGGPSLIGR